LIGTSVNLSNAIHFLLRLDSTFEISLRWCHHLWWHVGLGSETASLSGYGSKPAQAGVLKMLDND
ncbi:MAG TPA: hypothetical protein PKZ32_11795, partial [Candidatus Melainabacteria bacterium]|nr:hypothetical protein [Candidatus Melainabacteria bacterium]